MMGGEATDKLSKTQDQCLEEAQQAEGYPNEEVCQEMYSIHQRLQDGEVALEQVGSPLSPSQSI
jgi:hypothetical protein